MINKLDKLADRLTEQPSTSSSNRLYLYLIPAILFTSFALALLNLPIPSYQYFVKSIFGGRWSQLGMSVLGIVMQAVSIIFLILIYFPVAYIPERSRQQRNSLMIQRLTNEILPVQGRKHNPILSRQDSTGYLARALIREIKYELKNDCVSMHMEYQPKVNYNGEVMGAEALLRWNHPVHGYISPLIILSICEEANLTNELGRWIMRQSFKALKNWHLGMNNNISLSLNLSSVQLKEDTELFQNIKTYMELYHINPEEIELELLENATIDLCEATRSKLKQIRELGLNISIDDFGMGHSSLLYLCELYANVVKIDASLIRNITKGGHYLQIVRSILTLCEQLKVKVIAEGVETKEQLDILHELGCQYYQGFYFSRSLTSDKFMQYVRVHGCEQKHKIRLYSL